MHRTPDSLPETACSDLGFAWAELDLPALLAPVLFLYLAAATAVAADEGLCSPNSEPRVTIHTAVGGIDVLLLEDAAPRAVRRLVRLAEGPTFHPDLVPDGDPGDSRGPVGYYDGLSFTRTRPHVEIATDFRTPAGRIWIETQLDAGPLGLDERRIETAAEAMDVAQLELAKAYKKGLGSGGVSPVLAEWMERLRESNDALFLIGVSRREINEALGYSYRDGLASPPVTRGTVMLEPLSPRRSSTRLSIALDDLPLRTGRWMVVGKVVNGLETAEDISRMPLADPGQVRARHRPAAPVVIESVRFHCEPSSPEPSS